MSGSAQGPLLAAAARLTSQEVCTRLRISRATLWRRIQAGLVPPPVDRGRQSLFAATVIESLIERPASLSTPPARRSPGAPAAAQDVIGAAIEQRQQDLARRRQRSPCKR